MLTILLIGLFALLVPIVLAAIPGDLDPSFSGDGIVTTTIDSEAYGYGVTIQPDGKIMVAGYSESGMFRFFTLARYNTSGIPDPAFGTGGVVTTPIGTEAYGRAIVLQPDGKIVVAGDSYSGGPNFFTLARYTTSGITDTTFGTGGVVTTPISTGYAQGNAVALQSDGKIVVAGYSYSGGWVFTLARYTTSGITDTTFGTGGVVTTPIGTGSAEGNAVAIQSDGKIVVAGYSDDPGGSDVFTLVRYNTSGIPDPTFGTGGVMTTPIGTQAGGNAVAIQPDGKIVVAGYSLPDGDAVFALVRYNTSGIPDPTFGTGGVMTTPIGTQAGGKAVAIQPDGKIVVAGYSYSGSTIFALARYTTSGITDTTFGIGGVVTTPIGGYNTYGYAVAIQPDGKIVVAGRSNFNGINVFALTRYVGGDPLGIYLPLIFKQN
jgi:uncharacterized delta-60 repeat protein